VGQPVSWQLLKYISVSCKYKPLVVRDVLEEGTLEGRKTGVL
jgi:hypothetical protein